MAGFVIALQLLGGASSDETPNGKETDADASVCAEAHLDHASSASTQIIRAIYLPFFMVLWGAPIEEESLGARC
jgi:hypothetical protein